MKGWLIAIACMLGFALVLVITGQFVIKTEPVEDTTSSGSSAKGSKIVYELSPAEEATLRTE